MEDISCHYLYLASSSLSLKWVRQSKQVLLMAEWSLLINQIVVNCCASETPHVKFMKVNFGLLDQDSLWLDKMFDRWLSDTLIHYKSCWEMKVVLTCLKANLYRNKNFYVQTSVQIDSHIFAMGNKYTDQIHTLDTPFVYTYLWLCLLVISLF